MGEIHPLCCLDGLILLNAASKELTGALLI